MMRYNSAEMVNFIKTDQTKNGLSMNWFTVRHRHLLRLNANLWDQEMNTCKHSQFVHTVFFAKMIVAAFDHLQLGWKSVYFLAFSCLNKHNERICTLYAVSDLHLNRILLEFQTFLFSVLSDYAHILPSNDKKHSTTNKNKCSRAASLGNVDRKKKRKRMQSLNFVV